MVRYYEGADGLKTGHTDAAKYCLAATAKKDNMRLIAIVLGEEKGKVRNSEAMALLDYGFNNKKITVLKSKNEVVKEIDIDKGDVNKIEVITKDDVSVLQDKNTASHKYKYKIETDEIDLPIKKGDRVGTIKVYEKDKLVRSTQLVSNTNVEQLNYLELYIDTLKKSILGLV